MGKDSEVGKVINKQNKLLTLAMTTQLPNSLPFQVVALSSSLKLSPLLQKISDMLVAKCQHQDCNKKKYFIVKINS